MKVRIVQKLIIEINDEEYNNIINALAAMGDPDSRRMVEKLRRYTPLTAH